MHECIITTYFKYTYNFFNISNFLAVFIRQKNKNNNLNQYVNNKDK